MSLRTWYSGLSGAGRRIVVVLSVMLTAWIARAFLETAKTEDRLKAEAIEAAAQSRDSARVCGDSVIAYRPDPCRLYQRSSVYR